MAAVVNLDALIPREDFLASDGADVGSSAKTSVSRTDLTKGESFYSTLRKPDFQRETASWTPEAILEFIKAFIEGDLIPSVICWQSPSRLSFVIDGAHRLSAIIAWLNDDYGDGEDSVNFYNNNIPDEQRNIAKKTRDMINKTIGSYKDYKAETQNPGSNPRLSANARALAHSGIPLLWVKGQDSKKAERAFLTINQSAVRIDPTELRILNARLKPNAIASRAIVRNATGHKYWKDFSVDAQVEIEDLGKKIYLALYSPPLNTPIRTMELPIAGHGYGSQTMPIIFDLVNIANGFSVIDASKKKRGLQPIDEPKPSESDTVEAMKRTDKLARLITGTHMSSLGLHPAIYFYSANGRHQPTSVLAIASLLMELSEKNELIKFTSVRSNFEHFLLEHKVFINQLTTRYGSMAKGYKQIKDYYRFVLDCFLIGKTEEEIENELRNNDRYQLLVKERPILTKQAKDFSQDAKQLTFIKDALSKSFTCSICKARIDNKSMQLDHEQDKKYGGLATSENARWLHPFCNSTYKNHLARNPSLSEDMKQAAQ
ncbi:MAG: DUF262 domain-containing protein [Burkholderiales bacterium]|nr:DUF262 domain-containing protein [Burkholderiales bacterium]